MSLVGRQRQTPALELGKRDSKGAPRRDQEVVVAGQLHRLALPVDEIDRCEMERVEGANGSRKGL
jgi:hypothetical protein